MTGFPMRRDQENPWHPTSIPVRTLDAVVCQLWPSRGGIWLGGVEVKCSRADWLRELRAPEKTDAVAKFCSRFWIAVPEATIVKKTELGGWGLITPDDKGRWYEKIPATVRSEQDVAPLSIHFMAALLRRFDKKYREGGEPW